MVFSAIVFHCSTVFPAGSVGQAFPIGLVTSVIASTIKSAAIFGLRCVSTRESSEFLLTLMSSLLLMPLRNVRLGAEPADCTIGLFGLRRPSCSVRFTGQRLCIKMCCSATGASHDNKLLNWRVGRL